MVIEFDKDAYKDMIRDYMREIGRRGGSTKGESKRRGDSEYYRRISKLRKPKEPEQEVPQ